MDVCIECDEEFLRKTKNQRFCSGKCRTRYHVRKWAERNAKICKHCGTKIKHNASTNTCRKCLRENERKKLMETTLGDHLAQSQGEGKDRYNGIRGLAKAWNPDINGNPCQNCGYDRHSELAHIKAISEYDRNAKLAEVNSPNNLLSLCRNCHWEFDHGLLTIEDIESP